MDTIFSYPSIRIYSLVAFVVSLITFFFLFEVKTLPQLIFFIYLITHFLTIVITGYILVSAIKLTLYYRDLLNLTISLGMFQLAYVIETFAFFFLNTERKDFKEFSKILFITSQIMITVAPLILMIFISSYFVKEIHHWGLIPVLFEVILEILYQPLGITRGQTSFVFDGVTVSNWVYSPYKFWINVVYYVSIIWLVIYLLFLVMESRGELLDETIKTQQEIFILGITLVFIISPLMFFINIFFKNPVMGFLWTNVIARSMVAFGISLFTVAYLRYSKKFDFFQPQPLEAIYIVETNSAKIIYQHKYRGESNEMLIKLIVNNLEPLSSLLSEVLKEKIVIRSIELGSYNFLINQMEDVQSYTIILIVKFATKVIINRFIRLVDELKSYPNLKSSTDASRIVSKVFTV